MKVQTISESPRFYGYLVALGTGTDGLESDANLKSHYAMFEYNGEKSVWTVPDWELFEILASHLVSMVRSRCESDSYGYEKLWIEKNDGKWIVDLP